MQRQTAPYRALLPVVFGVFLLGLGAGRLPGAGRPPQITGPPDASIGSSPVHSPQMGKVPGPDPMAAHNASRLEHLREDERRKRLQSDAARLVDMSNALKTAVDNTAKDELSIDVVRRAAEIEKIAHDLKERMKS